MAKILLVEDDTNLSEIYQARMEAEGYTVISASDGESALAIAAKEKPDLIIADVMMPKISGFEMLDILRNTDGLKETPVVMLTALGQAEDKTRAESLGADKYLVKSQVTLEDIVKTAQDLLGDKQPAPDVAPAAPATPPAPTTTPTEPPGVSVAPATPAPVGTPTPQATPAMTPVAEPPQPQATPPAPAPEPTTPVVPVAEPPKAEPAEEPQPNLTLPAPAPAPSPTAPTTPPPTPEPTTPPETPAEPAGTPATGAAAGNGLPAQTTAEESAAVESQIKGFEQAPTLPSTPATPPADTTPEPTAPTPPETPAETPAPEQPQQEPTAPEPAKAATPPDAKAIDDKVVAHAIEELLANKPAPSVKTGNNVEIAHKKVIKPVEDNKPSIHELLAKEEANNPPESEPTIVENDKDGKKKPDSGIDPNSIAL